MISEKLQSHDTSPSQNCGLERSTINFRLHTCILHNRSFDLLKSSMQSTNHWEKCNKKVQVLTLLHQNYTNLAEHETWPISGLLDVTVTGWEMTMKPSKLLQVPFVDHSIRNEFVVASGVASKILTEKLSKVLFVESRTSSEIDAHIQVET